MKNLIDLLRSEAQKALEKAFSAYSGELSLYEAEVTQATQAHFGHYQCNSALKLSKIVKQSPREVAEKIIQHFPKEHPQLGVWIEKFEIAGPGFINIFLDKAFLSKTVHDMLKEPFLGIEQNGHKEKVIVEFSSPNVAKELHVGHLRSTIIGDALARLFEFLGYAVLRLNHIGDWGTQFGMLIAYLEAFHKEIIDGTKEADLPVLMGWYKESKKLFDQDEDFKKKSQMKVVELQSLEPRTYNAWKVICEISRRAYQEIYDLMDIKLLERGESFYNPQLKEIVDDLDKKGLITISDGAKCLFFDKFKSREGTPLPMIIQKSDGGYNYDTTDMAALRHRIEEEKADRIIYVTDAGQSLHFQMMQEAALVAGYFRNRPVKIDHVGFGLVLGPDGKKFKTRSGETERLIDLLHGAIDKAKEILKEKIPELSSDELEAAARCLGINAVKYADLACHRSKDYSFSYERMLKFEGNTAAFLMYAYVRCQSIKRKVGKDIQQVIASEKVILEHPTEIALALHLRQFGETLEAVAKELLPNRLADYLYTLSEHFNAFFRDCRVEKDPKESSRLLLCELAAQVLATGLHILGLRTLERM